MEWKPGVYNEDKTKNETETWIGGDQKAGDVDRRTPPEQGEGPTSAAVVTPIFIHFPFCTLTICT